jgi:hypothetical protein
LAYPRHDRLSPDSDQKTDSPDVRSVPCVDGSELARTFFT